MSYLEMLRVAAPEAVVVMTALLVLGADLLWTRELNRRYRLGIGALISAAGCVGAIGWMVALPENGSFLGGMMALDAMVCFAKIALLALTILTIFLSLETTFTEHVGEYFALVLLALAGMMFLVSAQDILLMFISLELTSLSLYILAAFNKRSVQSSEAALKYFLFGGVSAAFTLFGLSFVYGVSGATNLGQIAAAIQGPKLDPLLILGMVLTVAGFGFKVAAAPFHLWAPDVYEGAPIPSAAFIASGSKVAGFFVLARLMTVGFESAGGSGAFREFVPGWVPMLGIMAALSMVLGNLVAIVQSSVRRLLAYSAIAHAGYMLLGVMAQNHDGLPSLGYYVITYAVTVLGTFGVVAIVEEQAGGDRIGNFAGLSRRAPILSVCMLVFMLSLAGIPPFAGFFGKFYLFASALKGGSPQWGLLWLVILGVGMSAVSLYYYLRVLKKVFVADVPDSARPMNVPPLRLAPLVLIAVAVTVLGCAPDLLIRRLAQVVPVPGM
jgi:NADH-quinone oxidoreductase subunit N